MVMRRRRVIQGVVKAVPVRCYRSVLFTGNESGELADSGAVNYQ